MNYCIRYATTDRLTVSLDRLGTGYTVTVYDKSSNAITFSKDFEEVNHASEYFLNYAASNGYSEPVEVRQD